MSIASEIERIKTNIANAYTACEGKGAIMPDILNSTNLADCIASIIQGEPVVPSEGYATGASAIWGAEDGLDENNQWVDKISGHTFTPISSSVVPVYVSASKLLNFNNYGGMEASFSLPATSETQYTLELVVRDTDESTSSGGDWGKFLGPEMNNWVNKTSTFAICGAWNKTSLPAESRNGYYVEFQPSASGNHVPYTSITPKQHGLTTITVIPALGLWINGVKETDFALNCVSTKFALGTAIGANASYSRTKFKVHGVRYYPKILSVDEIAQNYDEDLRIYGA